MRILADENLPASIVTALRAAGHDVVWARTDCATWKDTALLEMAESQARILLTLDKDFPQIATQRRVPLRDSGIVLFRAHPATAETLRPLVQSFLSGRHVWAGQVATIYPGRILVLPCRKT